MSKYIIRTELNPMGGGNPEFAPDKELKDGIEADGFLLITFDEQRDVGAIALYHCTLMEIAQAIATERTEAGSLMRQACAVAEGIMRADEIRDKDGRERMARNLVDMLKAK